MSLRVRGPDMLTELRRLRPKAAKPRRLVGGSRARGCFEVVISHERAWRTRAAPSPARTHPAGRGLCQLQSAGEGRRYE